MCWTVGGWYEDGLDVLIIIGSFIVLGMLGDAAKVPTERGAQGPRLELEPS